MFQAFGGLLARRLRPELEQPPHGASDREGESFSAAHDRPPERGCREFGRRKVGRPRSPAGLDFFGLADIIAIIPKVRADVKRTRPNGSDRVTPEDARSAIGKRLAMMLEHRRMSQTDLAADNRRHQGLP